MFTAKGTNYQFKNHKQFSWVKSNQNGCKISIKKNFRKNNNVKVLIGTFAFKNKKTLKNLLEYTFKKKMKVNNEYYMDTLMKVANKLGYKLNEFVVDKYVSWGSHKEFLKYKKMISLIIPCFNEEKNIEKLLYKLDLLINKLASENIEIVIVNNGSTDNSEAINKQHNLYIKKKINLLTIKKNLG